MIIVIQPNGDWPRIHRDGCPFAQPIGEKPLPRYPIAEPVAAAMLTANIGLSCAVCNPHFGLREVTGAIKRSELVPSQPA